MKIRGSYTFSLLEVTLDNSVSFEAQVADSILIDATTSPTVIFDSTYNIYTFGAGKIRLLSGSLHLAGWISGKLWLDGSGDVFCEGARGLYSEISVTGPTLHLNYTPDTASISKLFVEPGSSAILEKSNQLRGAEVGLQGSVITAAAGVGDWIGPIFLSRGASINALNTGSYIVLTDDVISGDDSNFLLGHFSLFGTTRVFKVADEAGSLTIAGTLDDGVGIINGQPVHIGGISKQGLGTLRMVGTGSYNGPVYIAQGELSAENSSAFGAAGGGVLVLEEGILSLKGINVPNEVMIISGKLEASVGANTWSGTVGLQATAKPIDISDTGVSLKLSGVVNGAGTLILEGGGTLELAGNASNTYTGETVNRRGVMRLNKTSGNAIPGPLSIIAYNNNSESRVVLNAPNQISDSAIVLLNGAVATLDLSSNDETIGALFSLETVAGLGGGSAGGGQVWMGNSRLGTAVFTVGALNISTVFNGTITGASGMTLAKIGTGTFTLDDYTSVTASTFTGQTRVLGGKMLVNGYQRINSVVVKPGAMLAGTGRTGGLTLDGGMVLLSQLTTGAVATTNAGGQFFANLLSPSPDAGGFVPLHVIGAVNLSKTSFLGTISYRPSAAARILILENDGADPVQNTFNGLAEGAEVKLGNKAFFITYHGGDGNDVELVYQGWGGGKSSVSSINYDKLNDTIHLKALGDPSLTHHWQISTTLSGWANFATAVPDSSGRIQLDMPLGLHASRLFFRLVTP